jgi:thiol-disulfide isomerase/thioredoxin
MRIPLTLATLAAAALAACGPEPAPATPPAPKPAETAPETTAEPAPRFEGTLPGDLFPRVRATVRRGSAGSVTESAFDSAAAKAPVVYVVESTTCPYCNRYAPRLREIEDLCAARGVDVLHVYPNRSEPADEKVAWHAKQGFRGGQVLDADASIAKSLDVSRTPTAIVVDAKGVIAYRGGIDDAPGGAEPTQRFLRDAIEAVLAGKPVAVTATDPAG